MNRPDLLHLYFRLGLILIPRKSISPLAFLCIVRPLRFRLPFNPNVQLNAFERLAVQFQSYLMDILFLKRGMRDEKKKKQSTNGLW